MTGDSIFALRDSGVPPCSNDYTTIVLIHGYSWHSGIFSRLLPVASAANTRVVLLNRRDYPGSARISDQERSALEAVASMPAQAAQEALSTYMKARAHELYQFLIEFVKKEPVTLEGGLIIAGWSFGCNFITALLAESAQFDNTPDDRRLLTYLKRAVIYDPPHHGLGYTSPPDWYNPLFDSSLAPNERPKQFLSWVSGYYRHGDSIATLEQRTVLADPRPTILTISQDDMDASLDITPTLPGGSDSLLLELGIQHGLFATLRRGAVYLNKGGEQACANGWGDVKLKYVWCDHSVWEMPYAVMSFQAELEDARKAGKLTRDVAIIQLRGANHFYHWDQPVLALRAIIAP